MVWAPPIPSTHSSHPPLWHQTWVTAVEHVWTLCCISVAVQRSTLGDNWWTTVNCNKVFVWEHYGDIIQHEMPLCSKYSAHSSLLHTYLPVCNISWVRAPAPIRCTHCCNLTYWIKPWVTLVEQSWPLHCTSIVYNSSISRRSWNCAILLHEREVQAHM